MDERVRFGALAVYTVLYIAVADVLTSLVPYAQLAVADPIGKGVDAIGIGGCSILIEIGALTGLTIVILVLLFRQSRILLHDVSRWFASRRFLQFPPKVHTPCLSQELIGSSSAK